MRITEVKFCRKCGASIAADSPQQSCGACLLEAALDSDEAIAGVDNPDRPMSMLMDFGDYELLEQIGRGGQGVVFRARQRSLNRIVALKVIGLGLWATEGHLKRFRREAEAAARLEHPGIVPIHEVGERDGSCYFSMKFIEGGQLDEVVKHWPISIRRAAELMAKVARTVHYAHEHGILHRDIKPGNILLDANGEPHLTDFGLARLVETESTVTRTLEVLGTPSYMAPEQAVGNNAQLTGATDVYGLGAVLYQLLTHHPPFAGGTTYETIKLLLETEPRQPWMWNPKVDRDLSTICSKCLEKDPQRRYPTALALAEDLQHWLKHEPIHARRTGVIGRSKKWLQRNPTAAGIAVLSLALIAAVGVIVWKTDLLRGPAAASIAVLPFENLSNDKEDASFADGVQDDLLTKLAKISDLKVISRTSVMEYRDQHNTRDIGNALGVSHVLEGSVRKTGSWLHINVQLIDAHTDANIWAEEYDRDLKDMFAMQSEIAQKVAGQLHATISPAERMAIERPPTADLTAFDLYSRAKNLVLTASSISTAKTKLLEAADLLNQAVARDSSFFQAYCQLASTHNQLYFFGDDHTPARLRLAEEAVKAAFRLRPEAAEAHLARAENLYYGYLNYDGALGELDIAGHTLPNEPRFFQLKGYIERRQGHWEECTRDLERAIKLDPRNVDLLQQTALSYGHLTRYSEEKSVFDRVLNIEPNDVETQVESALVDLDWKADTRPLHRTIDAVRATNPSALPSVAVGWLICALSERDEASINDALAASSEFPLSADAVQFSRRFMEGIVARMAREDTKARLAFTAAHAEQKKLIQAQPNYGPPLCVLGLIDAALGRKEEALSEGRRAVELLSAEKDSINGPGVVQFYAMIAAWVGDKDLACQQLATATGAPGAPTYGQLKLLPFWDPLRGDPCFEKIVTSLAPK